MRYKSAAALEMAIKAAAAASPADTSRAIASFYFHRLLCRVFAGGNRSFVLKGGQAMLARTVDARATRDIDLHSMGQDLDGALAELIRAAETDLEDFLTYEFAGSQPIKTEDEYRDGVSLKFVPILGAKRMQAVSIDLVVDKVPLEGAELITPVDRIMVEGLETFDYFVYPVERALADKLCALVEMHGGRSTSRVKDLVDVAIYAITTEIDGGKLQNCVRHETAVRGISLDAAFRTPEAWGAPQERQFGKLCQMTGLPKSLRRLSAASELAGILLDPAIRGEVEGLTWNSSELRWK